jgi:hypothetical protein
MNNDQGDYWEGLTLLPALVVDVEKGVHDVTN